jgi:hypothetical protein
METPELIQSLSEYSYSLSRNIISASSRESKLHDTESSQQTQHKYQRSLLLLRILATAEYFTDDQNLMQNALPVSVDIIMDSYVLNIVPRSLLPTIGYICVVSVLFWPLARWISSRAQSFPAVPTSKKRE